MNNRNHRKAVRGLARLSLVAGGCLLPAAALAVQVVPSCATGADVPGVDCILETFGRIAQIILGLTGGIALVMFVYGGFLMLSSAGGDRAKKGIDTLKAAAVGVILVLTAGYLVRYGLDQLRISKSLLETPTAESTAEPSAAGCTVAAWGGSCSACTDTVAGTPCGPEGAASLSTCTPAGADLVCPEPAAP
ncbi:MAG: pilin [bacterium]